MKQANFSRNSSWYKPHAEIRTDAYVLLAAFLTGPPTQKFLNLLQDLDWSEDLPERLNRALAAIKRVGQDSPEESIAEEYQRLFVGLGSGEMVPYASWYREKMIQSVPLADIRADLQKLGIVRRADTFETEDHAGALCEIMALLSLPENEIEEDEQAVFFEQHVAPWMGRFFEDLAAVENAVFYPAVGRFGRSFLEGESSYLQKALFPVRERQQDKKSSGAKYA